MVERPILFSGAMVCAVLGELKTKTRRVVKGQALAWLDDDQFTPDYVADPANGLCPYGKPGDRLWVRETVACGACAPGKPSLWSPSFWRREQGTPSNPNGLWYAADGLAPERPITERGRWVPSIHMPRWASRILLEIVSVRIERLHDITEADAVAEGVREPSLGDSIFIVDRGAMGKVPRAIAPALILWEFLWKSINGDESWEANPWVWVVEFKRVQA